MGSPFFGIGLNDWSRPIWMGSSVDNFWLLWAMRYGLVGFLLLALPILLILYQGHQAGFLRRRGLANCRKGYVFSIIGVSTALATVAFWGGAYAMLCFLIGSGVWMMTVQPEAPDAGDPDKDRDGSRARALYALRLPRPRGPVTPATPEARRAAPAGRPRRRRTEKVDPRIGYPLDSR